MVRQPIIERPPSLGFVEPDLLRRLGAKVVRRLELASWNVHSYVRTDPETLQILAGVTEHLCAQVPKLTGHEIRAIRYEVDSHPMPPGGQQRDIGWHIDGDTEGFATALFATTATEFLVPGSKPLGSGRLRTVTRDTLIDGYINEDIENGVFDVYQPEPYEIVIMTDNVHRSPFNPTDDEIPRIWTRARLIA